MKVIKFQNFVNEEIDFEDPENKKRLNVINKRIFEIEIEKEKKFLSNLLRYIGDSFVYGKIIERIKELENL